MFRANPVGLCKSVVISSRITGSELERLSQFKYQISPLFQRREWEEISPVGVPSIGVLFGLSGGRGVFASLGRNLWSVAVLEIGNGGKKF